MAKQTTTTPDQLEVTTVSRTGKFSARQMKGAAYITTYKEKEKGKPFNQIAIEVKHTTGAGPFKKDVIHQAALINITFENGQIWSGTFEQLQTAINHQKEQVFKEGQ
jgi:hypothetical protein